MNTALGGAKSFWRLRDLRDVPEVRSPNRHDGLFILGGLVALLFGGGYLVRSAVALAESWGISPLVIGLTIVGFGTSMPELMTSVQAAWIGSPDIAVGNIIGPNIFNVLGILGATAMIKPLAIPAQILEFDIWIMIGAVVALVACAVSGWRISRSEGLILPIGYLAYVLILMVRSGAIQGG